MALTVVVVFGLVLGSFLNVVIARLPERRSLWAPRSACPGCGAPIAWYDNVPLLSFALLRGRCRTCAASIPWRYPLVEAVTGALFGAAWLEFGPTAEFVVAAPDDLIVETSACNPIGHTDRRIQGADYRLR